MHGPTNVKSETVFTRRRSKFAASIAYLQVEDYYELENVCARWRSSPPAMPCYYYWTGQPYFESRIEPVTQI